jgi:hypothetical protein
MTSLADKLGFYQVGSFKTYSKFLAISEHRKTNQGLVWNFNQTEFEKYDWTSCPTVSLKELYVDRANQLRNDYDVLVLFYSGGGDSQTVLEAFVDNGIHIDHIACCNSLNPNNDEFAYFNEEITRVALPYLNSISKKIPFTKQHVINQTDAILTGFTDVNWWIEHNNALTPNCVTRSRLRDWYLPFVKLLESGQSVAFIWGRDKPRILYDQEQVYTQFNDHNDNNTSAYSQHRSNLGWIDEFFFHDPQWPDIPCRQIHEVLNRLQENSISLELFTDTPTPNGQCPLSKKYLSNNGLNSVIYPGWDPHTFSNGKNPSIIWGARDQWFFDHCTHTVAYQNWYNSICYLEKYLSHEDQNHHWLNTDKIYNNIKGCTSPRYRVR